MEENPGRKVPEQWIHEEMLKDEQETDQPEKVGKGPLERKQLHHKHRNKEHCMFDTNKYEAGKVG